MKIKNYKDVFKEFRNRPKKKFSLKKWIIKILLDLLWKLSDSAGMYVEEIEERYGTYNCIPEDIRKEYVQVWEFEFTDNKKVKEWYNNDSKDEYETVLSDDGKTRVSIRPIINYKDEEE